MIVDINKIDHLNPELKQNISEVSTLNSGSVYLLELDRNLPASQFHFISKELSLAFESVRIKCITIPKGLVENVYKLKGGEPDDSRAGIE